MKKRTIFFLSVCAMTLSGYVVQADSLEAPSQLVSVPSLPNTGGQLSVVEEAGQMKAVLSNVTGEIVGVTGQFKSASNAGKAVAFTIDAQGQYVAYLDRTSFSDEDQAFTLALVVNLVDGSSHAMSDYHFTWSKEAETQQSSSDVNTIETSATAQTVDSTSSTSTNDSNETSDSSSTTTSSSTEVSSTTLTEVSTNPSEEVISSNDSLAKKIANTVSDGSYQAEPSSVQSSSSIGTQLRSASLMRVATSSSTSTQSSAQTNTSSSSADSTVTKVVQKDQLLEIKYTRPINNGEVIKFAVWSEKNSQDDIIWYNADQTGAAYADLRKHRDYGKYQIHTYANRNGKMVYLDELTIDVKVKGSISVSNVNATSGTFDVNITNVSAPRGLNKVYVPTWTESGGQDDIKWYEASRQSDGSYKLTVNKRNHKDGLGEYNLHLYYRDSDGNLVYIAETVSQLPANKVSGTLVVSDVDSKNGNFKIRVTNISSPKSVNKVLIPTWTESGGQDDIKWYEANRQSDGSYQINVNNSDHKFETGEYNLHLYYKNNDGVLQFVTETVVNLPSQKLSGKVSVSDINAQDGSFSVKITNVGSPKGLNQVLVPIWTEYGGQDDIKWYEGRRQTDGSYLVRVNKAQHKNQTGKYNIHVYYRGQDGNLSYVDETVLNLPESKSYGNISIVEKDEIKGSFKVRITDIIAPNTLSQVLIPTWTESGGQDDIKWYEASRQSDGSYLITVNKNQHKFETGTYNIHVYYRDTKGNLTFAGETITKLASSKSSGNLSVSSLDAKSGTFSLKVSNIVASPTLTGVEVVVSNQSNGSNKKSYFATIQNDGSYFVKVDKKNHNNFNGKYQVSVYFVYADYKDYIDSTVVNLPSSRSYTIYIDPGHGGVDPGATYGGIQEKNLAMSVANKLKSNLIQMGYQVLMTRTGDYNVDFRTERSRMANQSNADLFISLHFNATGLGATKTSGIETYWYQYDPEYQPKINKDKHNDPTRLAESEILAKQVQSSLISETRAVNRGVRRETFAVLRETAIPAILVELGFMDNPTELQTIKQDAYHAKLAKALAKGIDNWYGAVGGK
ncbi:TPA: GBS Bsp-like repeat-containing protein [Streptococcus suis]